MDDINSNLLRFSFHFGDNFNRQVLVHNLFNDNICYKGEFESVNTELIKLNKSWKDIERYDYKCGICAPAHLFYDGTLNTYFSDGYDVVVKLK